MKLSKLTIACLLATTGLSVSGAANAAITENMEFHGYVREGVFLSYENDFKESGFVGQKETLGRLGLEYDNDANASIAKTWTIDEDKTIRISAGIDDEAELGIGVELGGITSSGILWGGDRDHGKDNYIFMTDFFYTDMSGTGVGVDGYEIGDFFVDAAYIASNRDWDGDDLDAWETDGDIENFDNYMHAFNIAVTYDALEVSGTFKAMPDNWDENGIEYAETGADITAIYSLDNFFFIPGNGHSTIIAQAGYGLGSGNLLGGTITDYNGYHPGSLAQGVHTAEWGDAGDAQYLLTHVGQDYTSARLLLWGGYTFDNGISLFPSIQGQYNDMDEDGYNYWLSAMIRPIFPVSENFFVQTEFGTVYNNWNGGSWNQQKATIAPTYIIGTGLGVDPQIRFMATYVNNAWSVDEGSDIILAVQTTVNW